MIGRQKSGRVPYFCFSGTTTTEIYTLSLHDALPIWDGRLRTNIGNVAALGDAVAALNPTERRNGKTVIRIRRVEDRKSTRLNSSHSQISYAVFCLKKKKKYHVHLYTTSNNKLDAKHI